MCRQVLGMPRSPISQVTWCADSGDQRPEVPLHVVVAQVVGRHALLGADEVLELHRVAHEEDRGVVADHVEVALGRVELQREAARVPPGVWAAALAGDGGEPGQHLGLGAGLEHRGPGVLADVVGHLEVAERAAALGVRLALRDAFPVEVGHLLDQVVVLQQDRAVGADGQRMLVTGCRRCRHRSSRYFSVISACSSLRLWAFRRSGYPAKQLVPSTARKPSALWGGEGAGRLAWRRQGRGVGVRWHRGRCCPVRRVANPGPALGPPGPPGPPGPI